MYCKGSAFFIITSKYKVESIVLSKSFDISYNYYPPQNTIAELSYCFYIVWNLTIYLFETFILGVIKGVNHITHWFTPLFAEREGFEPPVPLSTAVFKTAVIDHSTISPEGKTLVYPPPNWKRLQRYRHFSGLQNIERANFILKHIFN